MDADLEVTGICQIRESIMRWQEKISEYVAGRPI